MSKVAIVKGNIVYIFIIVLFTAIVSSCSNNSNKIEEKCTLVYTHSTNFEDTLIRVETKGDAHSGNYFSRADSANIYGSGFIFNVHDSLLQADIRVKFEGWVRVGDLSHNKDFALSLEDGNGHILKWEKVDFRSHIAETNKWTQVIDSITFPANIINRNGLIIKSYSFNPDGKSTLDCDDIKLLYYKIVKKE